MPNTPKGLNIFVDLCASSKDEQYLEKLLDLFLTFDEKENLAMRCLIIKELLLGKKTQREMAQDLMVSIAKITRGSNELKRFDRKFLLGIQKKIKNYV